MKSLISLKHLPTIFSRSHYAILGPLNQSPPRFGHRFLTTPTVSSRQKVVNIKKENICSHDEVQRRRKFEVIFDDSKEAFKSKSSYELLRALVVFWLCNIDFLARNNLMLLNTLQKLMGKRLFEKFAKATFYGHFVAGESLQEVCATASNLSRFGVQSMFSYTVEAGIGQHDKNEDKRCEQNVEFISHSIKAASSSRKQGHKGFAAVKLTAICQPEVLEKISGKILEIQQSNSSCVKTPAIFDKMNAFCSKNLSIEEFTEFQKLMSRLTNLVNYAANKDVRLMIDAEESYLQPAISRICMALMRKYNEKDTIVMNTYQAYLKQMPSELITDLQMSKRYNFQFGCKLVRGAYMEHERERAKHLGYADPINDSFEATNRAYDMCLERIVKASLSRGPQAVMLMVASHNEDSIRHTLNLMEKYGISPSEQTIYFGQLYGMCDQITFPLGEAGFNIYKCLYYGPLQEVLPYLSRRAEENTSAFKNTAKERELLWTEFKRRAVNKFI